MRAAEELTGANRGLILVIALGYGGRWDLVQAARQVAAEARAGALDPAALDEAGFAARLALAGVPEPDLFIRTGGEQRISNFLLWDLAYTELWFSEVLWPDFDHAAFDAALAWYATRERRFGGVERAESA
jgi:undecaprenyl diphosphate synthase